MAALAMQGAGKVLASCNVCLLFCQPHNDTMLHNLTIMWMKKMLPVLLAFSGEVRSNVLGSCIDVRASDAS